MTMGQKPGQQSRRSAKETPPDEQSGETSPMVIPDDIKKTVAEMCDKYVGYEGPSQDEIEQAIWAERQKWQRPPVNMDDLRGWMAAFDEDMLLADGYEDAVLGVAERCGQPSLVVYDADQCINVLVKRDGMDHDDAEEFFHFNTLGAWMGEHTPLFLWKYEPGSDE